MTTRSQRSAQMLMRDLHEATSKNPQGITNEQIYLTVAAAQVHATIALAEAIENLARTMGVRR